jgi:hypothetical protein
MLGRRLRGGWICIMSGFCRCLRLRLRRCRGEGEWVWFGLVLGVWIMMLGVVSWGVVMGSASNRSWDGHRG